MKGRLLITLFLSAALCTCACGADGDKVYYAHIDAGYIIGGQVYNDNFLYNPGISILGSFNRSISKRVNLGIGTGALIFEDATFLPVYAEFTGYRSKKKNPEFIVMQLGYSHGWNHSLEEFNNYDFRGGLMVGGGFGMRFEICEAFDLAAFLIYRHQFARVEYEVFDRYRYREELNYDLLTFGVRLIL
jgi:hypothetical protein